MSLILGDIHSCISMANSLLNEFQESIDEVVYVGDYFDNWNDTVEDAKNTAYWLKKIVNTPNHICCLGNHDLAYMFPNNGQLNCPGWTEKKSEAINEILSQEDWSKFKLAYKTQGFWISHAGITKEVFEHPILGLTDEVIEEKCKKALIHAKANIYSEVLAAGYARGGRQRVGGITWAHWSSEFKPIAGLKQIVGHTFNKKYRSTYIPNKKYKEGENHCIDCGGKYSGMIDNGIFKIVVRGEDGLFSIVDV